MIKRLTLICCCAFASVALSGCPWDKTDEVVKQSGGLIAQLTHWTDETKGLIGDVDQGAISATDFRPAAPPPRSDLNEIDAAGVSAGVQAKSSAGRMREGTDLTEEEAQSVYCFVFDKALAGELSTDPATLESQVLEYVEGRFTEHVPQLKFRADMEDLGEAIEDASEGGAKAMETAMATACDQL